MNNGKNNAGADDGREYRVVILEKVDDEMKDWFGGLNVRIGDEGTIIEGRLVDQSDLQGLLRRIHDLHLTLISVETIRDKK